MLLPTLTQSECQKDFLAIGSKQHIENNILNHYANMKKLLCDYER